MPNQDNVNQVPNYILDHSDLELQRLISQSQFYLRQTKNLLWDAGIESGMKVLDLGSGTGDVSFLASKLVGPNGSVVGVDKSSEAVTMAKRRASAGGYENVKFVESNIHNFSTEQLFDIVIGRLILMYQPDPVETVSQVAKYVKPGALVIFQELDFTSNTLTKPHAPLYECAIGWIKEVLHRANIPTQMGLMLYRTFVEAGLPAPEVVGSTRIEGGKDSPMYEYIAESVRSLLPRMEQFKVTTAEEVQVDTLAKRLCDESVNNGGVAVLPMLMGAWSHK